MKGYVKLTLVISLLCFTLLAGCDQKNHAPVIHTVTADPHTVGVNNPCIIRVAANDLEGDSLIYSFSATAGTIEGNSDTETWTAPSTEGSYTITVTVSDGKNESKGQVVVLVKAGECVVSIDATNADHTAAYNNMRAGNLGQTFTAVHSSFCGFQFKIGTGGGIHGEITTDSEAVLYDVSGTAPVELARKTFPAPLRGVTDFFFDRSIPVQVGKKYYIGIDTKTAAWGLYQICNCNCSCYDGGGRGGFQPDGSFYGGINNTDDYYFKVYTTSR